MTHRIDIAVMIPGGVLPTDHLHVGVNDNTCSRCRKPVDDEVPLLLWLNDGNDMLIYCETCTGADAHAALAPTAPKLLEAKS